MWNKKLDKNLLSYEGESISKNLVSYCEGEGFDSYYLQPMCLYEKIRWYVTSLATRFLSCNNHLQLITTQVFLQTYNKKIHYQYWRIHEYIYIKHWYNKPTILFWLH
jgi:hypothetical protein